VPFWIDLTKPIVLPAGAPYIRIINTPKIEWCHDSEKIIESINRHLYKKNKYRDDNVTVTTHYTVPGIISSLLVRSPLMDPTGRDKACINPCFGIPFLIFGFGGIHAFLLARSLPVVKHKVHKKASLVQPVVDDSWLKQYKVKGATMTPSGAVFGNVQMVDSWDCEKAPIESYQYSQPMFVNPMPLYVTYDTALRYETPSAPPYPYMCMDTDPGMAQAGYGPSPADMAQPAAYAPADPSAQLMGQQMPGTYDPNAAAAGYAQPYDPNAVPSAPVDPNVLPSAPSDPNAGNGYTQPYDPNSAITTTTTNV